MTKIIFHLLNIIFVFLYIYPGSLLGFFIYGDILRQPQITSNFIVSSNHVYAFFLLSSLGLISYFKSLKIIILCCLQVKKITARVNQQLSKNTALSAAFSGNFK